MLGGKEGVIRHGFLVFADKELEDRPTDCATLLIRRAEPTVLTPPTYDL